MIIGLAGKMGVGKNFYANYIVKLLQSRGESVLELSFADQIKINVLATKQSFPHSDAISRHSIYNIKNNYTRSLLQQQGTLARDIDSDIWLRYMQEWIYLWTTRGIKHFVINDVRFQNEVFFIESLQNSAVLHIVAPIRNQQRLLSEYSTDILQQIQSHSSETSLDNAHFTYKIDNDPIHNTIVNQYIIIDIIQSLSDNSV